MIDFLNFIALALGWLVLIGIVFVLVAGVISAGVNTAMRMVHGIIRYWRGLD